MRTSSNARDPKAVIDPPQTFFRVSWGDRTNGLTLSDDLKQHIDQQLVDIIQQSNASNAGSSKKHEIKLGTGLSLPYARGR
jgi:alkyl hydroperoxide reductase subunit AhpF